jgi:hypothetical protein
LQTIIDCLAEKQATIRSAWTEVSLSAEGRQLLHNFFVEPCADPKLLGRSPNWDAAAKAARQAAAAYALEGDLVVGKLTA